MADGQTCRLTEVGPIRAGPAGAHAGFICTPAHNWLIKIIDLWETAGTHSFRALITRCLKGRPKKPTHLLELFREGQEPHSQLEELQNQGSGV